ncbi:MAG: glycosyltransferase family 2 protein, partial [Solirubrobacteraceae bacterium]
VYVLDNGSTDGTWDVVQELARELPAVVPWKSERTPFSDALRAGIYREFRSASQPGDWWCRLDADEFYIDDPRVFLQRVEEMYDVVWTANFSYYFTDKDAALYAATPELYGDDVPIEQKIRYYVNHWSEPRFFRFRQGIVWNEDEGFPAFVYTSPAYPVRMWQKHFPYRSPLQIERRLSDRQEAMGRGVFIHEAIADWGDAVGSVRESRDLMRRAGVEFATQRWEDRIVAASTLEFDAHDRRMVLNESLMPPLPVQRSIWQRALGRLRSMLARAQGAVGGAPEDGLALAGRRLRLARASTGSARMRGDGSQ